MRGPKDGITASDRTKLLAGFGMHFFVGPAPPFQSPAPFEIHSPPVLVSRFAGLAITRPGRAGFKKLTIVTFLTSRLEMSEVPAMVFGQLPA